MAKLSRTEIAERMKNLGWTLDGETIRKQYTFAGFPEAIAFVNRLVPEAEAADHHPDIAINYKRVTLTYSTHSEGGLTAKDFDGAPMADRVACRRTVLRSAATLRVRVDVLPDVETPSQSDSVRAAAWYELRPPRSGTAPGEWTRHAIDEGGRMGGGLQIVPADVDGDGDLDVVSAGKTGLFLAENLTKSRR